MGVQLELHRQFAVGAGLITGEQGDLHRDRALRILLRQVMGRACRRHGALGLSLHTAAYHAAHHLRPHHALGCAGRRFHPLSWLTHLPWPRHPAVHGEHPAKDQHQAEGQCYAVRRSFHGRLPLSIFFAVVV
jgi:hypothetical protein